MEAATYHHHQRDILESLVARSSAAGGCCGRHRGALLSQGCWRFREGMDGTCLNGTCMPSARATACAYPAALPNDSRAGHQHFRSGPILQTVCEG